MPNYTIVLIGAGNVATQLGLALKQSKHQIIEVYSKQGTSATALAKKLKCNSSSSLKTINTNADIYIIAVNDDAIAEVAKQINLKDKIVVHTSGSVSLDSLKKSSKNYGVFYPLQTFSINQKADFKKVPMCLEANNPNTFKTIEALAKSISNNTKKINSAQRASIHIAAVFACNFSNHLYTIADDILKANTLSLDILKPLIAETAKKIENNPPAEMQTGPAIRGDKKTIKKHLQKIRNKEYRQLYKLISKGIAKQKKGNR